MKLERDQQFTVYLTPLTPVHIGCAVDYEPTDTLIHDKQAFHLKGLIDWQSASRDSLANKLKNAKDYATIQTAFISLADELKALAPRAIAMPFSNLWATDKKGKINTIERTAFNSKTGVPIITGSALKGAFRNAHIERNGEQGNFDTDPLRQLKISDSNIESNALTAVFQRQSRHRDMTDTSVKDPSQNYAESLLPAQKNVLECNISVLSMDGRSPLKGLDISKLIDHACLHTFETIQTELSTQRNNAIDLPLKLWFEKHSTTLQLLRSKGAALLRVGKHVGAEQLTDARGRKIKTKYNTPAPISTTLAFNGNIRQPFGFMLLIPCYAMSACEPLLDQLLAAMPTEVAAVKAAQHAQHTHQENAIKKSLKWEQDAQEQLLQAQHEQTQKIAAEAARIAAQEKAAQQTPQQNAIDSLIQRSVEKAQTLKGKKLEKSDACYAWFISLITQASSDNWTTPDKQTLADAVRTHLPTLIKGFLQTEKDGRKAIKTVLTPLQLPENTNP